ncbi:transcriptional regulator [Mycobacterium kansasii]|uniref:helix-turn-helix transcriptional regulator n=1 Tax=Mycobacterium kansasii TaxID=1768 RepID=UPI000CDD1776|nr:helix-turn-helix domain-containing protein [Mycobacterium kansasii]POX87614.1 transcriptional regulator [Mycobacterium kansasii]
MTVSTPASNACVESTVAAPMIGVEPQTLKLWRRKGIGPRYVKFGNRVRYRVSDIEAWLSEHTVTPELAAAQRN